MYVDLHDTSGNGRRNDSVMSLRANALATRLEQGARALAALASRLTDRPVADSPAPGRPQDRRGRAPRGEHVSAGDAARTAARAGQPIAGVTWDVVHGINAEHALDNDGATKDAALALLAQNSAAAAAAIRALTDDELDCIATISLYGDAPLTCQFWLEDHPVRHSYHHLPASRRR